MMNAQTHLEVGKLQCRACLGWFAPQEIYASTGLIRCEDCGHKIKRFMLAMEDFKAHGGRC